MVQIQKKPLFLRYVCWNDESKFTNDGCYLQAKLPLLI